MRALPVADDSTGVRVVAKNALHAALACDCRIAEALTTELDWGEIEKRSGLTGLKERELTSKTKKLRRVGETEWDLLRRAALLNAPTDIALTFADYIDSDNTKAWRFEQLTDETIQMIDEIERVTGARVSLISTGFMQHRGVIDRRDW